MSSALTGNLPLVRGIGLGNPLGGDTLAPSSPELADEYTCFKVYTAAVSHEGSSRWARKRGGRCYILMKKGGVLSVVVEGLPILGAAPSRWPSNKWPRRGQTSKAVNTPAPVGQFVQVDAGALRCERITLSEVDPFEESELAESMSLPVKEIRKEAQRELNDWNHARKLILDLAAVVAVGEDDAIEFVYERFYRLIDAEAWGVIDEFLRVLNVEKHYPSVLLSVLTITALSDVRDNLLERDGFFDRVMAFFAKRENVHAAKELLYGLE